jgi:hypothetical protein
MGESYRALCNDFYVNQKLQVKLDLPKDRGSALEMFERIRKQFPHMSNFRRYKEELALESVQSDVPHRWCALRTNHLRSGTVNAATLDEAYELHRAILELAPMYLSISPLDVDCLEVLFGFDMLAQGSHDQIVFDALYGGSPLANVLEMGNTKLVDCQPTIGLAIPGKSARELEAFFEVKTRSRNFVPPAEGEPGEPISVYLTLRRFGSVTEIGELQRVFDEVTRIGQEIIEHRLIPRMIVPLREAIASGNA